MNGVNWVTKWPLICRPRRAAKEANITTIEHKSASGYLQTFGEA